MSSELGVIWQFGFQGWYEGLSLASETFQHFTFHLVSSPRPYLTVDVVVEVEWNIHVSPPFQNFREEELMVSVMVGVVSDDDPALAGWEVWSLPDIW